MSNTDIPDFACEPLRSAVTYVRKVTPELLLTEEEVQKSQDDIKRILGTCGRLCTSGCIREAANRLEDIGQELPPDSEREEMFDWVGNALMFAMLDQPLGSEEVAPKIVELKVTAEDLKEITERRLGIFEDVDLQNQLTEVINRRDGTDFTAEDVAEGFKGHITPIDNSAYEELMLLTKGNIRASLALISYMMDTYPLFRSDDPEMRKTARSIATRGFTPANPYCIGARDVQLLSRLIHPNGMIELPTSHFSSTWMFATEDPEKYEHYTVANGEVIDVFSGNLPDIQKRHLPAIIEAQAR